MKRLLIFMVVIFVLLLSVNVQAGRIPGSNGNPAPGIAPPHSNAHGKSLSEWLEAYSRWLLTGVPESGMIKNVAFLPLPDPSIGYLEVEVKTGTTLVLPMVIWLGEEYEDGTVDPSFPSSCFGDTKCIWGKAYLDGKLIMVPNENYYVGPDNFVPPIIYDEPTEYGSIAVVFYQGIACLINPLPPGVHELTLISEFVEYEITYNNEWKITVVP